MLHGRARPFSRTSARPPDAPTQAETTSWQAAVIANSGTVSAGRFTIVNNFIAAEKAAGTWQLTDDYWALWAENVPQALTSLKQLRLAVSVSAPNFTTDRDYTFNGTANYLNTGFVPSTHAVAMTASSCRLAVYERTNVFSNSVSMAGNSSTANNMAMIAGGTGGAFIVRACCASATFGTVPTSAGWSSGSRRGATVNDIFAYKNAVPLTVTVPAASVGILPTFALYIGAGNLAGTAASFRANSVGFACVGAGLSDAQETAQYANVQAWAISVGANV